ncbi:GTP-binding protein [Entomortierella parvispora]|uniref:GTP-binding protein n=1 Tax=Entomortierella parvispora TaxID=205924 RepID=A0A9P3GZI1_9FUNG|nr:GTP-binding protein [Entomortierella parvispora]
MSIANTRTMLKAGITSCPTNAARTYPGARHLSTTQTCSARLPYFHKQLTKNEKPLAGAVPNSLTPLVTPPPAPKKPFPSSSVTSSKGTPTSSTESVSKRQQFRSITPSAQLMNEIRIQGLGSKAESWSFDKSTRGNKTIRPWDKKLDPEAFKQLQKEKRLPAKQVWFEQRTSKIVEKEQVKFPGMRFVAGAGTTKSVPKEELLLKMTRPDLFDDLEEIEKLLQDQDPASRTKSTETTETAPEGEEGQKAIKAHIPMSAEEIQKLKDRKRALELKIRDSVLQEIAIVGRSNVGKSTMLNTLTESPNTARVSSKPGLTRQLNFYKCGDKFVVVDMPGYGFAFAKEADKANWKELIEDYIGQRKTLKRIYVMIDARHGLKAADKEFLAMLDSKSKKFQVVLTKCDLVPPPDLARIYMVTQEELKKTYRHAIAERLLMVSSYTGAGMNTLRKDMLFVCGQNILVRERERPQSTIR